MNQLIINTNSIDITKPADFAQFVALAKEVQGQLDAAWDAVHQQMLDSNVAAVTGDWGKICFEKAEQLTITDAEVLDPGITKPALDTKKVRAYRELMGELPQGVGTQTITKFAKRIKK